jgi:hypothetical protein
MRRVGKCSWEIDYARVTHPPLLLAEYVHTCMFILYMRNTHILSRACALCAAAHTCRHSVNVGGPAHTESFQVLTSSPIHFVANGTLSL